ncbi:hypothetical protein SOVF_092510 [Spinacia oleracea]|nr:hypothetical protein SOVF_092510 [Spinacia oleracea]
MDMTARATIAAATITTTVAGGAGLSIVPPAKSPEAESETPHRIQPSKPFSFSNGVLKRHAPSTVLYKKCLKNHAASLGGHALDGCGEFMPAPTATALDPTSLKCAACGCHRNFHWRELEEMVSATCAPTPVTHVIEYHPHHRHHPLPPPTSHPQTVPTVASRGVRSPGSQSPPPISSSYYPGSAPHMLLALSSGGVGGPEDTPTANNNPHSYPNHHHQQQHQNHHHHGGQQLMNSSSSQPPSRKRFRTKFSQHQKDKMQEFAEKVGWKMQKTNDDLVNGFCNEINVERGVFKVWMHNNKNSFSKRSTTTTNSGGGAANCDINPINGLNHNPVDDEEDYGHLNGNGNSNSSISINDQPHHHSNHHQYNGGKSHAPTNGSSSSS